MHKYVLLYNATRKIYFPQPLHDHSFCQKTSPIKGELFLETPVWLSFADTTNLFQPQNYATAT